MWFAIAYIAGVASGAIMAILFLAMMDASGY